jgi:ribosome-associated protein
MPLINSSKLAYLIGTAAAEKKAQNIKLLNISDLSSITDYFVVCSGNSIIQVKAIADEIEDKMKLKEFEASHREGYQTARWILLDYGNVIVHVFHKEDREFYDIERLWADAVAISI